MPNNEEVYKKYQLIRENHEFSAPLLVPKDLKDHNPTVMYIGQETNGWGNGTESLEELENWYKEYYYNLKSKKPFWKFIKEIYEVENDIHKKVIWCNALIAGKIGSSGNPLNSEFLEEISIENLVNIYNYFDVKQIIIVTGPNNPYYKIVREFLNRININLECYPTIVNKLIVEGKVIWTYHPNYQNKRDMLKDNIKIIKKIVK
jgi:hypothetical protein